MILLGKYPKSKGLPDSSSCTSTRPSFRPTAEKGKDWYHNIADDSGKTHLWLSRVEMEVSKAPC